jgi:hypothetical protein
MYTRTHYSTLHTIKSIFETLHGANGGGLVGGVVAVGEGGWRGGGGHNNGGSVCVG